MISRVVAWLVGCLRAVAVRLNLDQRNHGRIDKAFAGILEIDGDALPIDRLDLAEPPIPLGRMTDECARDEEFGHRGPCEDQDSGLACDALRAGRILQAEERRLKNSPRAPSTADAGRPRHRCLGYLRAGSPL